MGSLIRSITRVLSFPREEIVEMLRQPRLVLTLILGPFLILLLVGIGYRGERPPLRTEFVVDQQNPLKSSIEKLSSTTMPRFVIQGTTSDEAGALDRLRRGELDLVVVAPRDAAQTIQASQQAVFTLYHREIDPTQVGYVTYLGYVYTDQANRDLLQSMAATGQTSAADIQLTLNAALTNTRALREALQRGDSAAARQQQTELSRNLTTLETSVGASKALLAGVGGASGNSNDAAQAVLAHLSQVRQSADSITSSSSLSPTDASKLAPIEQSLSALQGSLNQFRQIDPHILVSPFRSETKSISIVPRIIDFFVPAVIVLLLQHLAVTFAALSLIRDRRLGLLELFRVSPVSAIEILIGKYLSYLLIGGILAVLLTLLTHVLMQVPMLGRWPDYGRRPSRLRHSNGFSISLTRPIVRQCSIR
jgi:ABC-2 type transport system permease protein